MSKVQCLPHWQVVAGQPDDIIITSDIEKNLEGNKMYLRVGFRFSSLVHTGGVHGQTN